MVVFKKTRLRNSIYDTRKQHVIISAYILFMVGKFFVSSSHRHQHQHRHGHNFRPTKFYITRVCKIRVYVYIYIHQTKRFTRYIHIVIILHALQYRSRKNQFARERYSPQRVSTRPLSDAATRAYVIRFHFFFFFFPPLNSKSFKTIYLIRANQTQ